MRIPRLATTSALVAAAFFAIVAESGAAIRYAGAASIVTTGSCDQSTAPCRLDYAINAAGANDTVVVLPGTYNVTWTIQATQTINVEGQSGQPRPRLLGDPALAGSTVNLPKGGSIKHVYLESKSGSSALSTKGTTVSDVLRSVYIST